MIKLLASIFLVPLFFFVFVGTASAHCDCMDGPVVTAARKAFNTGNINHILVWIKPDDEEKIRKAFRNAQRKRKNAKNSRDLEKIDINFFKYLVKVHREGEGAKFDGLKPAGNIDPAILMLDEAVEKRNLDKVLEMVRDDEAQHHLISLFNKLMKYADYDLDDVKSGREYIEMYAHFLHIAEKELNKDYRDELHLHIH